jgi:hypothetical protein
MIPVTKPSKYESAAATLEDMPAPALLALPCVGMEPGVAEMGEPQTLQKAAPSETVAPQLEHDVIIPPDWFVETLRYSIDNTNTACNTTFKIDAHGPKGENS